MSTHEEIKRRIDEEKETFLKQELAIATVKDWVEDHPSENGCYTCQCLSCGSEFKGHKRRIVCRECSMSLERTGKVQQAR